ncbi:MAG: PilT/PilU family type 4a pilus ATPase [Thermoanaerobaculia bacterium]|nr:PilT/PilU family type 4a pilus ATPase [Thermoanaerobaculia bacterium]
MARLHELFIYLRDQGGSDLHLVSGLEPRVRRNGHLEAVPGWDPLLTDDLASLLEEIVPEDRWASFLAEGDLDFAYGLDDVARYRGNYLKQEQGLSAVFRIIPQRILTLEELKVTPAIERLAHLKNGLVLVTGPTGSGKSTTLAAIIDRINRTHRRHIVTIEDPIEFVHSEIECVFSQREVGRDTQSFGNALKAAIRQDADVILVGEMRDQETIALAITAAEMGTLVFGTLHTNSAANTIDRLIDAFPAEQQAQIRTTLSESLAAIVAQLLLRTADGNGRVAANEILFKTSGLPNVIREGNTPMIRSIIQGGRREGMQLMDDALTDLMQRGIITPRDAYQKAAEKQNFEAFLES